MSDNYKKLESKFSFDQYGRHLISKIIIDQYKLESRKESAKILDIGGLDGSFRQFLDAKDPFYVIDPLVQPDPSKNYIKGDATDMKEFEDNSFDILTAHDVLEHIPRPKRDAFLKETYRVAKDILILTGPLKSDLNERVEEKIRDFYHDISGENHPWLQEHYEYGLPENELIENFAKANNANVLKFYNNDIRYWQLSYYLTFMFAANQDAKAKELSTEFNTYYNSHIFPGDVFNHEEGYRTVFVLFKNKNIKISFEKIYSEIEKLKEVKDDDFSFDSYFSLTLNKLIECIKENRLDLLKQKESSIGILQTQVNQIQSLVENEKGKLSVLKEQQSISEEVIKTTKLLLKDTKISLKNVELSLRNTLSLLNDEKENYKLLTREYDNLNNDLLLKSNHITNLENIIRAKEELISEQSLQIENLNLRIHSLSESIMHSHALKYSRFLKRIMRFFKITPVILLIRKILSTIKRKGIFNFIKISAKFMYQKITLFPRDLIKVDYSYETSDDENYDKWVKHHLLTPEKAAQAKKEIKTFSYTPKISIVVPVYNVELEWLRRAVLSVYNQYYPNWELVLVDDASPNPEIKPFLKKIRRLNKSRIKLIFSEKNQHISLSTNTGIQNSTGEFVGFLDNDDEITQDALFEAVKALNVNPEIDLIYSDEDKITLDGKRTQHFFKPDWSPELLENMMYTTHLSIYRKSILDEIGGCRKGFEGSQDYDLVLRFTEKIPSDHIYHIPKVLYHWRMIPGSTATHYDEKSYAGNAARKALTESLKRRKIDAELDNGLIAQSFTINRKIIGNPKVSIIIPTKNRSDLVNTCINSIKKHTKWKNYEIIIVDNNSDEKKSIEDFKKLSKEHKVIQYTDVFNYSAINNFAVANFADGEHLLFLNNDIEVISDNWLEHMLGYSQRKEIGAVGAKLVYPNNTIQHAGVILGLGGVAGHSHWQVPKDHGGYMGRLQVVQNYLAVTGACLMVKKEIFEKVKGFNEKDLAIAFNDVDLCLKIYEEGYRNVYVPQAELYHYESVSRGSDMDPDKLPRFLKEVEYMQKTWKKYIDNDPFYNPNLSLEIQKDFVSR